MTGPPSKPTPSEPADPEPENLRAELQRLRKENARLREVQAADAGRQSPMDDGIESREALCRLEAWLTGQMEAFQLSSAGASLENSLGVLVHTAVQQTGATARCGFYLLNPAGTELRHVTGMGPAYAECVNGFEVNGDSLACGLAVHLRKPVITPDVQEDPRWEPWRWMAAKNNFRGCWSFPIETLEGRVVGTFALYFPEPRVPTRIDLANASLVTRAAAIIISSHQAAEERARALEALCASEAKYRMLFESIDDGFCIIEVLFDEQGQPFDYRFLEANPAQEKQTGLTNLIGKTVRELIPGHDQHWYEIYGKVAQTGEPTRFENDAVALGRCFDVYAFRIGPAEANQVAVVFRDITERKRREANTALLDQIGRDMARLVLPGEILKAVGSRVGLHLELSGCLFVDVHDDSDTVTVHYAWTTGEVPNLQRTFQLKDFLTDEFQRAGQAGEIFVVTDTTADSRVDAANNARLKIGAFVTIPFRQTGKWTHYVAALNLTPRVWREDEIRLLQEVAERLFERVERARAADALRASEARHRNAEERLRLLVDSSLEHAIITLDVDRVLKTWNPGAARIFGYTAQEAIGQTADIIFTPEARAVDVPGQEMRTALEKGRAGDDRWMLRKDGSRFWANGAMLPMYAPGTSGPVIGFVKILRDETATKEAKEALETSRAELWEALRETERARDDAEAAGRAKDHFLAILSHELRTPLTPVLLASKVIERRSGEDPMVQEALGTIRRNVGIEARFINDLLDATRIGHGKFEITSVPLNLHDVVRRAVAIIQPDCDEKNQALTVSLEAGETAISGDDTRLEQVACNLLKNASKFTPEAGRIEIHTFNEKGCVVLEVTDSGIGIETADQALIFDAFAQANQTTTQKFGGLGLGLAIAKAIVDGHGGQLAVRSGGRDQGATFSVRLPLLERRE